MKVLYISKALVVAAYRSKLQDLGSGASVTGVVPRRWGRQPVEQSENDGHIHFADALFHGQNHLHLYPRLSAILADVQPDIVHIDEEPYSLVTLQAARLCRKRDIPAVFFAWQNLNKRLPPPFGRVRRAVFESVAGGIAGTDTAANVLREAGFNGALTVVPQFGVDPAVFQPRKQTSADSITVGYGGRLVNEKGVDILLRAVAQQPGVNLSIAGDGPAKPRLLKLATELHITDRVVFRGHMRSLDMPSWLQTIDVLALPSRATPAWAEQFGRILVEAMACGIPVIATRSGEIPNVVQDGGLLIGENDVTGLRAGIELLARDPELRLKLGTAGRARVLAHYTNERIAFYSLAFYQQIMAGCA